MTKIVDIEDENFKSEDPDNLSVPVLKGNESYDYFFKNHLQKNLPCIIKNVSKNWNCSEHWICDNRTNYKYFIKEYGNLEAPVANCNEIEFNSHSKKNIKIHDYMHYLMNHKENTLYYLKDWHLRRLRPNDEFYEVPLLFSSDWLNEYAVDNNEDDFRFVYIGPAGSWTPLHSDVYSSYSWSVNVTGLKKWILFPPGEELKLKDTSGNMILDFIPSDYEEVKYFEIYQEKGDAIFVPSNWHHQVVNILETISVNHNWINGCNIQIVWESLQNNLQLVEKEIEEFKDTPEYKRQCQLILKSLFGMDYQWFVTFLLYIAKKRLNQLKGTICIQFDKYVLGKKHIMFDLNSILNIINLIFEQPHFFDKCPIPDLKNDLMIIKKCVKDTMNTL